MIINIPTQVVSISHKIEIMDLTVFLLFYLSISDFYQITIRPPFCQYQSQPVYLNLADANERLSTLSISLFATNAMLFLTPKNRIHPRA